MREWARSMLHRFGRPDWAGEDITPTPPLDIADVDRRLAQTERELREIKARQHLIRIQIDPRGRTE